MIKLTDKLNYCLEKYPDYNRLAHLTQMGLPLFNAKYRFRHS